MKTKYMIITYHCRYRWFNMFCRHILNVLYVMHQFASLHGNTKNLLIHKHMSHHTFWNRKRRWLIRWIIEKIRFSKLVFLLSHCFYYNSTHNMRICFLTYILSFLFEQLLFIHLLPFCIPFYKNFSWWELLSVSFHLFISKKLWKSHELMNRVVHERLCYLALLLLKMPINWFALHFLYICVFVHLIH